MKQEILFKFLLNINYVLNIQHGNTLLSDRYDFAVISGSKYFFFQEIRFVTEKAKNKKNS